MLHLFKTRNQWDLTVSKKLKRKIDSVSGIDVNNSSSVPNNNTTATPNTASNLPEASVFNFDTNDTSVHSAPKIGKNSSANLGNTKSNAANNSGGGDGSGNTNGSTTSSSVNTSSAVGPGLVPSLSVQIVQQFSGNPQQDASQTIHTNVTVSSRYSTSGGGANGSRASPNGHSVHTSVQCKQEPASADDSSHFQQQQHLHGGGVRTPNANSNNGSINNIPTSININQQQQFTHQNNHQNFNQQSNQHHHNHNNDSVGDIGIGIDDVDELQKILDSLEKNEKNEPIDPSLLKELNDFNEICDQVQRNSESGESAAAAASMFGSQLTCPSPGALSNSSSKAGVFTGIGGIFDSTQPMGGVNAGPNIPLPSAIPEPTGPAAETLKQLAAHHQHQQHAPAGVGGAPAYGMKGGMMSGGDPFSDGIGGLRANGGFPPTYSQLYRPHGPSPGAQTGGYPGYDSTNAHHSMGQITPEMAVAMGYNTTKPLSHFQSGAVIGNGSQMGAHPPHALHHNSPSSLQQLQNQVQSHFKPAPGVGVSGQGQQLQMSQNQHMQVSHGAHSLQMSQTQQVHIQQQQQQHQQVSHQQQQQHVTLSQQQNFSISQQQMVSEQVKMQMMEKMRMEQQQQQQQHHHQQQQHQQQQHHHHQRMPPQYMGRPPPEYKTHPNARPGPYNNVKAGGIMGPGMNQNANPNPLQTMQNMVNQTSVYGTVKSEVVSATTPGSSTPVGVMQQQPGLVSSSTTQITAVQQQTITMTSSNAMAGSMPQQANQANGTIANRPGFAPQQQQMQQPPAYSSSVESASSSSTISRTLMSTVCSSASASTLASSLSSSSSTGTSSSTYSSAIMRNQRPPNVNVGPDGLNISQSRPHGEWPVRATGGAGVMMQGGIRPGVAHPGAASMQGGHMMQYGSRPPHYGAPNNMAAVAAAAASNMAQLQQQGQVGGIRGAGMRGGAVMGGAGGGAQMMMQHQQTIHMSQQMAMHSSSTGYNMGGPSPGAASGPNTGYALRGPSPGLPNSDFGMGGSTGGTPGGTSGYSMGGPSPGLTQTNAGYAMGGPSPGAGPGSSSGYSMGGPSPSLSAPTVGGFGMGGGPSPGGNAPMHTSVGGGGASNQQSSPAQPTGYPPPTTTSTASQDAFLHFLDNPLSSQPMFDSIQTSTADDFCLLEDILNCK
ncbi:mastermind-like protein 1 [Plakobranchus ocellatus]|uniref:Mastermind-like protein 1 n=1 Tax=Plakobranchus ocellatus TaxID=259542 RepID=A0AAV3ZAF7_9GAST|nr:mastermind-like protein 1 [Plakobranchus ocellatus]